MLRIDFFRKRRLFFGNPLEEGVQNFYWVLTTILAEEGVSQKNLSLSLSLFFLSSLSISFPPSISCHSLCIQPPILIVQPLSLSLSLSLPLSLYPFLSHSISLYPPPFFHPPLSLFFFLSLSISLPPIPLHTFFPLFYCIHSLTCFLSTSISHFLFHILFPKCFSHSLFSPFPIYYPILFCSSPFFQSLLPPFFMTYLFPIPPPSSPIFVFQFQLCLFLSQLVSQVN